MLTVRGRQHHLCGGVSRREFLRVGGLGAGGLSLATLLKAQATAGPTTKRPKSVIYIVLNGGPSHIDTWDPKPDAPVEYRGEFNTIPTKLPGIRFCEHMPRQAEMLDKLALLRGVQSVENDHYLSEVYTGLPRVSGKRPAFGSVVSRLAESSAAISPYVCLNELGAEPFEYQKPHYAGPAHAPFRPFGDALENLAPVKSIDRLMDRRALLDGFSRLQRYVEKTDVQNGLDRFQAQALQMITSPEVRQAFDLSLEPKSTFEKYGRGKYTHQANKSILYDWETKHFVLARRLVEAGVRVVTMTYGRWDSHGDNFGLVRDHGGKLDQCLSALIEDLTERGMIDDVTVIAWGEFGRTPRINASAGRDHWPQVSCAFMAGGGLRGGQAIGATNRLGEYAKDRPVHFQEIFATLYRGLGIAPESTLLYDPTGRPQHLTTMSPIREIC